MANSIKHARIPWPIINAKYTVTVPYLDADGDPTDPTTPDTEISKDAGSYADTAEEVTTVTGSNGTGYLTLTGAEMDCGVLTLCAKVASGPKATLMEVRPMDFPIYGTGTATAGGNSTITLQVGSSAVDDFYVGMVVRTTGGTGGGGTGGANNQARLITSYVGSTRVATVSGTWETNPSSDTTYDLLLTPIATNAMILAAVPANVTQWLGTAVATPDTAGYPKVTLKSGTGTGEVSLASGAVTAGTVSDKTGYRLSATGVDDILDEAVEDTETMRQMLRLIRAACLGITTDSGTKFRDRADTKNRIDATLSGGNRTVITTDPT